MPRPAKARGRSFAWYGGVAGAVKSRLPEGTDCRAESVDGLTVESMKTLRAWAEGKNTGNLLEVMACMGGCVAGPSVIANPKLATAQLKKLAEASQA